MSPRRRNAASAKRPRLPRVAFDRFYRYDDLTRILREMEQARPDLLSLTRIGKSHERRDIWLCTVTNTATGPAHEKPALWVDANIHAGEVTGSTAALHLVFSLLRRARTDARVRRALDTRCFYVVPRLNPDGAELALADRPTFVRSSTRPWPPTDRDDGLHREDVDGDGRILTMRIQDPNGTWKVCDRDARLMVPREPDEDGPGPYYRLLPEGTIKDYDGAQIRFAPTKHGLDINRNYPMGWRPHGEQGGSGPYPTSEPEIRSVVQAMIDRTNICGFITYHTSGAVHLRPYSTKPDDDFPTGDLRTYRAIGKQLTAITGYRNVSVYHDFRYDLKDLVYGASDDWAYDHLGVYAWTTEFWSPIAQAGITDYHLIEWFRDHTLDEELRILAWADEHCKGLGYVDWYAIDHPQLGKVELGGWDAFHSWQNPPPHLLEAEITPHTEAAIHHALISPQLRLRETLVERRGTEVWRIRVAVENTGWLPTNVTEKAIERRAVRPLEAEITLPRGARLASGDAKLELGQLSGRALRTSALFGSSDATTDRAVAEWVVTAPDGSRVAIEVRHQRAGVVRCEVELSA